MSMPLRVLIVEDSEDDTVFLLRELRRGGFDPAYERVDNADDLRAALNDKTWDLVISDHVMPRLDSHLALKIVRQECGDIPFIVISGKVGEDVAVEVMKAGANDYLMKDKLTRLAPAIERELVDADSRQRRRRVEQELRESEEMFSRAFHASPGLFEISEPKDGAYRKVNETWIATLGYSREEAMAHSAVELGIWVDPNERERFVERLEKEGSVRDFEAKFRTKDGREIDVLVAGEFIDSQDGSYQLVVSHDVTERKQAEAQLRQAQKMEAVGQLTGGVAHDFNNLLAIILGNLELLEDQLGKENRQIQATIKAADRGADLVRNLLTFSRQQAITPRSTQLGPLIEGMTDMLRRTLGETIEITFAPAPGLWTAMTDPGQLENALLNLAINARDAMPGGGVLSIEVTNATLDANFAETHPGAGSGDYVVVAVSDTGTGMSRDVREHAFEPFFTTKEVGEGSGLGLSMVYGFVRQSGGYVTITSAEGHGTTVNLYLPRARRKPEQAEEAAEEPVGGRGETVLVVEDDAALRELVVTMLKNLGYGVREAADGPAALAVFEDSSHVDLLLSDVVLPGGMTGFDLAHKVVERYPALKVLLMSGYAGSSTRRIGSPEVPHEFLYKPFAMQELAQKLHTLLDR